MIKVEYDATVIGFSDLLEVFFHTHDPTTIDCQGSDIGEQYRSIILYQNESQKELAQQFIEKYPKNERAYEAKFMIGFTQAEELKDYDGAEKTFKDFLAQYPSTDLSDDASWMLENMRSGGQPDLGGR